MSGFLLNLLKICLGFILAFITGCIIYVIVTAFRIAIMEVKYEREKRYKE